MNERVTKYKLNRSIAKYLRWGVLAGSIWKNFKNREVIHTHGETGRNEPKRGDLPVGWRETVGLENSLMRWFQPQLKIIFCYKNSFCYFFCGFINSLYLNLFLCCSNILSLSKLSLFLVARKPNVNVEIIKGYCQGEIFLETVLFWVCKYGI